MRAPAAWPGGAAGAGPGRPRGSKQRAEERPRRRLAGQRERRRPRRQSGGQRQPKLSLLTLGLASTPQVWAGEAPLTASPRRRAHLGGVGRCSPGGRRDR